MHRARTHGVASCRLCQDRRCSTFTGDSCHRGVPGLHGQSSIRLPENWHASDRRLLHGYQDYKQIRVFKKEPISNYPSEKVLGMMFREIDPEPQFNSSHNYKGDHDLFTLDEPKEWRAYLSQVAASKAQYNYHVTGLLRRYVRSNAITSTAQCIP